MLFHVLYSIAATSLFMREKWLWDDNNRYICRIFVGLPLYVPYNLDSCYSCSMLFPNTIIELIKAERDAARLYRL